MQAVADLQSSFPFPLRMFDSDNGSEFINHDVADWLRERDIAQTRSRPYKKNDQATVESKNNHVVHKHAFHWRYDTAEELALLAPQIDGSDAHALLTALARPGREVVAKLGPDGAAALVDGQLLEAAGHRVDVVDTVGAGDAFVAGYLSARLDGQDVPGRLERANACGALACTAPGDWEGAPDGAALGAFLHGGEADPVSR